MKKAHIVLIIILSLMACVIAYSVFVRKIDTPLKKQNVLMAKKEDKPKPSLPKDYKDMKEHIDKDGYALPYQKNTVKIGQEFKQNGMSFIVNNVQVTKKAVDTDADYYVDAKEPIQFDAEGNITNDYTYIVVNLSLKNEQATDNEFYLNMFRYAAMSKQTNKRIQPYYTGSIRGYKTRTDSFKVDKSYFRKIFKPEEQYTCNLVFIEKDTEYSDCVPYLELNSTGVQYNPEGKNIFVKLS